MTNLISPAVGRITSPYGPRRATFPGMSTFHKGTDVADVDDAIVAASDGVVVASTYQAGGAGNYVTIDIGQGVHVRVHHLASRGVSKGQRVITGQWLGKEGATGSAQGIHCHVEVIINGVNVDPAAWFASHGVTLGSAGTGSWGQASSSPTNPTSNMTLAYQQRQNRYGAAGLKEDGISGPLTEGWGDWVGDAQAVLNLGKSNLPKLKVDRDYGPKMHARVREAEALNNRPMTGILSNADIAQFRRTWPCKLADRPKTR